MPAKKKKEIIIWELLRFSMAFIFLWAFFDKLLGLGFDTPSDKSWIAGNSPTVGFLKFASKGPFSTVFKNLAGNILVDWLFMVGLLGVGLALLLGIGIKIASYSGALMMFFMWLVVLPKEHNPILDEHIVYTLIFLGFPKNVGYLWGFREKWSKTKFVKKCKFLK